MPALTLTGELDGGCNPRVNRIIASELPNAELVTREDLKHAILPEASDRGIARLLPFLRKESRSRT